MKAYKCDMCGDYYEGYSPIQVPGSEMRFNKFRLIKANKNDLSENIGWKDYDICPKCARVIARLMTGSKVKEEEDEWAEVKKHMF